jgi:CheY-like chemotaxis protein
VPSRLNGVWVGNTSPADEQRYRAAGFDEFLSKPLTPDRLFEVTGLYVRPNADAGDQVISTTPKG